MNPPSQKLNRNRELRTSAFVRQCVPTLSLAPGTQVLDLPAGTGRHGQFFAELGHAVTLADIDERLVRETETRLRASRLQCRAIVVDARHELPFTGACFDLALVVDFVDQNLLATIGRFIRPGGHLIYESYSGRGGNWSQLLPPGCTEQLLAPMFAFIKVQKVGAGPSRTEAEVIKLLAKRR